MTDKGKAKASDSSADNYLKTLLSNTHFRPQTMLCTAQTSSDQTIERIHFGRKNLIIIQTQISVLRQGVKQGSTEIKNVY